MGLVDHSAKVVVFLALNGFLSECVFKFVLQCVNVITFGFRRESRWKKMSSDQNLSNCCLGYCEIK